MHLDNHTPRVSVEGMGRGEEKLYNIIQALGAVLYIFQGVIFSINFMQATQTLSLS